MAVLLVGIGLGAYNVGLSRGVAEQWEASGQLVPIDGPGFGRGYGYGPGFGFFPFGFLWFGLIAFGFLALARGARRRGWGRGPGRLDDWHRRQHETPTSTTSAEDR